MSLLYTGIGHDSAGLHHGIRDEISKHLDDYDRMKQYTNDFYHALYVGNKIYGDVDFHSVGNKAKNITPVPGGVGVVTATDIFENFLNGLKYQADRGLI